ncbi:hypothetical protein MTR67_021236 [Solanum verrucosum]|uniref:peptidylprolyl isomerase n=1 Tax=Solanum verrucosum TaxID=315347 RepID=A0AAF0QWH6_SOLVR|nr:hypothetical protein MTR67_021236 [Solanum verrucosum]
MAATLSIQGSSIIRNSSNAQTEQQVKKVFLQIPISRRSVILISVLPLSLNLVPQPSMARERRNKKNIPLEDYQTTCWKILTRELIFGIELGPRSISYHVITNAQADGLKYYDILEGKGPVAEKGSTVQVHFDCVYRNITAVSSRESKLLAGNRIISQPYEFQVGAPPGKERKRDFVDNPNGLFSAQAAPKPPKAMYTITEGMKVGGKRTVIVPPEAGYGSRGMNEIPPGATFNLNIELLEVKSPERKQ